MPQIFFIVGRGRSGTTLLARMLTRHPELPVAPEGFFAMSLYHKYRSGPFDARRIEAFCRDLVREERMRRWGLDVERLRTRLVEREGRLDYQQVCLEVYAAYAEDALGLRTPMWVGDKNPHYALLIQRLDQLFPQAHYIHITRDYRDNVLSYIEAPFDLNNPAALAERWKQYNTEILKISRSAPERFLWLRYEDLVVQPVHELTRICRFLSVEYDAAMLAFAAADTRAAAESLAPARKGKARREARGVRSPLDPSLSQRWQRYLSEKVIRRIDSICGEFAARFGYQATTHGEQPLSLAARLGALYGLTTVAAEKFLFGAVPPALRISLINGYRRVAGRT